MRLDRPLVVLNKLTPALLTQVTVSLLGLVTAFGAFDLDEKQIGAILAAVGTLGVLLTALGIISATNGVTPVSDPQLPAGTQVKVTDAENNPTHTTTVQ